MTRMLHRAVAQAQMPDGIEAHDRIKEFIDDHLHKGDHAVEVSMPQGEEEKLSAWAEGEVLVVEHEYRDESLTAQRTDRYTIEPKKDGFDVFLDSEADADVPNARTEGEKLGKFRIARLIGIVDEAETVLQIQQ